MSKNEEKNVKKKPDPKDQCRMYYQRALSYEQEGEKCKAQMLAVAETMGWTPQETNEVLGSNVIAPAPEAQKVEGG